MNDIRFRIPDDVKTILGELEAAGHSAYIVGGAVRDAAMGKEPHDYDVATSASPEEMKAVFRERPVIETGLKHGTLTVVGKEDHYEVTTYRIDGDYGDSRHPESVRFVDRIEDDLARRDFTVNAMAYSETLGLVDPFGGLSDIRNGIIRCVGEPDKRLTEDALRILRGVRFSAVCGFSVEEKTKQAMFRHRELLSHVSAERKQVEFSKLLVCADHELLCEYRDIFAVFIPEIIETFDFDQHNYHHCYDVYTHMMHAVSGAPHDLITRLSLFFHDIGKPATYTVDENGVGHFYDHAKMSHEITARILKRLKYDNLTVETVCKLVLEHGIVPVDSLRYARKLLNRFGADDTFRLLTVARCDIGAQAPYEGRETTLRLHAILQDHVKTVLAENQCVTVKDLAVNGKDIMALGVREGREVGELLKQLLEAVLEHPEQNEKETLLALATKWLAK